MDLPADKDRHRSVRGSGSANVRGTDRQPGRGLMPPLVMLRWIVATGVGYVHMLVDRDDVEGRLRVFASKH